VNEGAGERTGERTPTVVHVQPPHFATNSTLPLLWDPSLYPMLRPPAIASIKRVEPEVTMVELTVPQESPPPAPPSPYPPTPYPQPPTPYPLPPNPTHGCLSTGST
jgi:hypothetical protein